MIFPEGTRSRDGELQPFKDGAFRLAIEAGVPILPLAVNGAYTALVKGDWRFGVSNAEVRVLEPIPTDGMTNDDIATVARSGPRGHRQGVARTCADEPPATSHPEVADALAAGRAGRGARVDDHQPWHAVPDQRRDGDRGRADRPVERCSAGDDRSARRHLPHRSRRRAARAAGDATPTCTRPPPATCRGCWPHVATVPPPWRPRCASPRWPASACSPPAASAASTAARRRRFDISADLTELASTPVAVVSAGIKSILDIGLTLERLETLGVPVVVNGSDEFPSFYSRRSGLPAPRRLDGPAEIAAFMAAAWQSLGLSAGISIANPIPADDEIPADEIHDVIERGAGRARSPWHRRAGRDAVPARPDRRADRWPQPDGEHRPRAHNAAVAAQIAAEHAAILRPTTH